MRTTAMALAIAALLVVGGCRKNTNSATSPNAPSKATASPSVAATTTDPEQLGRIGAEIKRNPKDADRILADHGMTQASFEKAIRAVSSDPAASRRYRDAYRKAGA